MKQFLATTITLIGILILVLLVPQMVFSIIGKALLWAIIILMGIGIALLVYREYLNAR